MRLQVGTIWWGCCTFLVACNGCNGQEHSTIHRRSVKVPGTLVTLPEQEWSDADAEWFYSVSQGSQLIPYSWLTALKTADGKEMFAKSIEGFGYIPRDRSHDNPLGLAVGFVKNRGKVRDWLGLNCAACHTAVIEHVGKSYLIDGGPTMANIQGLLTALSNALDMTLNDSARFDAFAEALRTSARSTDSDEEIREQLELVARLRREYNRRNMPKSGAPEFGHGRVDAIGAILNEASVRFIDEPKNHHAADAPVSYPFLWDTPQHDKLEWNGSAPNSVLDLGNLARNVGEVLGVFGDVEIPMEPPRIGYRSTVEIQHLREIELKLKRLKSPLWPADIERPSNFQKIATAGKAHFDRTCAGCHSFKDGKGRDDNDREIVAKMDDVGTDPKMAENFRLRRVATGRLNGSEIDFLPFGAVFGPQASGETVLKHIIVGTIAGSWKAAPPDALEQLKQRPTELKSSETDNKYKGRPLNGIWATAPFLHNGSVPTLRDLLKTAGNRPRVFWVGSRRFNPTDVGFESGESPGATRFDTEAEGNSNKGHEYGTGVPVDSGGDGILLKEAEILELLEYLKSL